VELICVRHGRTAWNAVRRFQGQTDIPLDEEGLAQAQALAAYLRAETYDLAVTSDLGRAVATAEAICAGRAIAPVRDPALREMGFGVWEGLTWDEIVARTPELSAAYEKSPRHYTPAGGESWTALCLRVEGALRRITAPLAGDARVLIVSHAGVMHAIAHAVTRNGQAGDGETGLGMRFSPGGILRVSGSFATGWTLVAINETADSEPPARAGSA
jgi:broad specificity phosphatase PhoE